MQNPFSPGQLAPWMLYGTAWKEERTRECVRMALECGVRGFDTANQRKHYYEAAVGSELCDWMSQEGNTREALFIQTKFTFISSQDERLPYDPEAGFAEQVRQSFRLSLEHLHTESIDSYVLHGPSRWQGLGDADWEVWAAMEALQQEGKVRWLGISNVDADQLSLLCERVAIKPTFVQNRCYAHRGWDREVRQLCAAQGMIYQGFSLLTANKALLGRPEFNALTARLDCTPAQAIFCFARQAGMLPLTGTSNAGHLREDLDAARLSLSDADFAMLESLLG